MLFKEKRILKETISTDLRSLKLYGIGARNATIMTNKESLKNSAGRSRFVFKGNTVDVFK
jgi:hypothetical protein